MADIKNTVKIVSKQTQNEVKVELPPAGDERREVLKQREDALQEAVDTLAADPNAPFAIDPSKIQVDRDIMRDISGLSVSNAQHDKYTYKWVNCERPKDTPGILVRNNVVKRIKIDGVWEPIWEVVKDAKDPEAREFMQVDNTRRVGDVILLRCKRRVAEAIILWEQQETARREQAILDRIAGLNEKFNRHGGGKIYHFTEQRRPI